MSSVSSHNWMTMPWSFSTFFFHPSHHFAAGPSMLEGMHSTQFVIV